MNDDGGPFGADHGRDAESAEVHVVVLTGGRSSRMGSHKPALEVGGRPIVERVVDAARPWPVLVVGRVEGVPDGIRVVADETPDAGPLAALATAVGALPPGPKGVVVLLAGDLPFVTHAHLERLVSEVRGPATGGGATGARPALGVSVDADGRRNWLCSAWRADALVSQLAGLGNPAHRGLRDLVAGLPAAAVTDVPHGGAALDVDTPADLERARAQAALAVPTADSPAPQVSRLSRGEKAGARTAVVFALVGVVLYGLGQWWQVNYLSTLLMLLGIAMVTVAAVVAALTVMSGAVNRILARLITRRRP